MRGWEGGRKVDPYPEDYSERMLPRKYVRQQGDPRLERESFTGLKAAPETRSLRYFLPYPPLEILPRIYQTTSRSFQDACVIKDRSLFRARSDGLEKSGEGRD